MSSTVSTTEIRTMVNNSNKKPILFTHPKMEEKRLVRTSSLEKIRRFNTYICSQQYYILPALLAWLRSSHMVLQSSTETTIFFFRSLIFNNLVYRLYQLDWRAVAKNGLFLLSKQNHKVYSNLQTVYFLKTVVYLIALVLMTELCLCFYLLSTTHVPNGMVFLILCWFYIIYLNVRCCKTKEETKKRN